MFIFSHIWTRSWALFSLQSQSSKHSTFWDSPQLLCMPINLMQAVLAFFLSHTHTHTHNGHRSRSTPLNVSAGSKRLHWIVAFVCSCYWRVLLISTVQYRPRGNTVAINALCCVCYTCTSVFLTYHAIPVAHLLVFPWPAQWFKVTKYKDQWKTW